MSRIELNVVATGNFRNLETSVARLRTQVDALNASMLGVGFNSGLGKSLAAFQDQFNATIDQSGMFERHMVNLTTETTRFGRSLESGSMRLGQLFRTATEYRRGELGQIRQLAREQVRLMNATTMRMADGGTQVIVPRGIDEGIERQRILNQEYRIFRQVVQNGSTEIINWGKNTQWAGRQLTVGLTVPLTIFGAAAGKMFMDADKQLTRMAKVYGDATKGMVDPTELAKIRSETLALSQEIARSMGVAVEETLSIAADIAATGKEGNELLDSTREAMRLSVLGEVDRQEAMRATLAIQSVFKKDTEGLTQSINLLNAVENQTSATIDDLVTGIVKAGPVVQGLGGDVEDLAAMMVAMREGGITASEAANAIKSSLASLINPTKQTTQVLGDFGIDIKSIVDKNAGDVIGTLMDLQSELSNLDELSRQRSIEQIFGKFQFSRINALLANLGKAGSQTQQVFSIANMSVTELARNAEQELTAVTESAAGKFQRAVESIKANLIPIGEVFVQAGTIILNIGNKILEVFNSLPEPVKNIVNGILGLTAIAGPIIMITGVLGNFFGYLVKGLSTIMAFKKEGRGAFELLTLDSIAARDANELLSESLYDQATAMNTMASAVDTLVKKLQDLVNSMKNVGSAENTMAESMANAEAATFSRSATPYTTPAVNLSRKASEVSGWESAGVEYSHLTAESHLLGTPGLDARKQATLGLGTFVQGQVATLQSRLNNMIVDLLAIPTEAMATPEQRRAELLRIARRHHAGNQVEFEKTAQIIQSLTDEQLAQILPSWEKISLQTSQYAGIMSASAKAIEQGNVEAKKAMETFKTESLSIGREKALENLRRSLREAGVSVEQEIQEISGVFERIAAEASQVSPGAERAEFLLGQLANPQTGVVRYETNAQRILEGTELAGFDKKSGFNRVLMLAIQSVTDAYFNEAAVSEELAVAAQSVAEARRGVASASEEQERAAKEETEATERLAAAKDDAQKRLQAAYKTGPRDLSDITRRVVVANDGTENVEWLRGNKQIPASQAKLIDALNKWYEESVNAATATASASEKTKLLTQGQADLDLANQNLVEIKRLEAQDLLASMALSDELYEATIALAQSRRAAAEIRLDEERLEAANAELALARSNAARADQKRLQAQLTYGFNSPEALAASELAEETRRILAQKEQEAAGLEEQLNSLRERKIANLKKQEAQEQKIIALRNQEVSATQRNIASTDKDTISTGRSAASEDAQTAANLRNIDATNKDTGSMSRGGGIFAGGKIGGAISLLSMAGMFLPRPGEDTGLGQGMNAGINILNMAGMGAMFGGPGIAAGAGIGVLIESFSLLSRRVAETNKEMEGLRNAAIAASSGLLDIDKQFFQVEGFKGLEGLPLDNFKLKTEEATDRLAQFAEALLLAEEGTVENKRVGEIAATTSAQEFIGSSMFQNMIAEALLGGMSIEDIKVYMGGYLKAAGKEVYAGAISDELSRIAKNGGKNPREIGAKYVSDLERVATEIVTSAGYTRDEANRLKQNYIDYETARAGSAVQITKDGMVKDANVADLGTFLQEYATNQNVELQDIISQLMGTYAGPTRQGLTPEQALDYNNRLTSILPEIIRSVTIDGMTAYQNPEQFNPMLTALQKIVALSPDLANIPEVMSAIGNSTNLMAGALINAAANGAKSLDEFINAIDPAIMENNQLLVDELINRIDAVSPAAATAFNIMTKSGVSTADSLKIAQMVINDIGTDWQGLARLAAQDSIRFNAEIWTTYVNGSQPGGNVPAAGATSPADAIQSALGAIDYSGGGGSSGGSSGSDYYDKLIEAQDKIIEGIQKEREERQKLLDIQEKQMDFALRRQDLENQIARAVAEGNLAEAALLQAELDAEQKKYDTQEAERKLQEREDRRIAAAEKEKERLQKLKEAASGSGSGGGASGGVSEAQKQWTANRVEILTSGVVNWTEGAELRTRALENGPWSAFFNSDKVKQYRQELEKLNIPAENIDQILNDMFDSWIDNNDQLFAQTDDYQFISDTLKDMGIQGDKLKEVMPDIFGALLDKNLNPKEKIDVIASALYDLGYETDEAYRKAKKMYEQYNKDFDGKGIDDEIEKWINWNDRIKEVRKQLKKTYEEAGERNFEYDRNGGAFPYGAPQSATIEGLGQPSTINAGGVQIDAQAIGASSLAGVVQGWEGDSSTAGTAIRTIAKFLLEEFKDESGVKSPSWKYELIGKDMIAGLMNGLVLPEDSGAKVISSLNDTFTKAAESYSLMFTNSDTGINAIMDKEVTLASDNFFTKMTTRMQETVDEINRIVGGIKDYQFNIIGNPKIYTGGAPDIWTRVFSNVPTSVFTNELPKYQTGGYVEGPGGPTEDKILAQLSNGEYVIKASSVDKYGTELLDAINNRKFANGGYVSADRAEYAASRRPTYFGGTPTSSTGYNRPANNPVYSGGTPTWSGGYQDTNYQAYSQQRDKTKIQTFGGANWSWDSTNGKWVKLADVKTGAAASGFALMASGLNQSINTLGFWGTLGMMASGIKEDPASLLPFVGSSRIDTSTEEGKDMFAASSLLDIMSLVPVMTGVATAVRAAQVLSKIAPTAVRSSVRNVPINVSRQIFEKDMEDIQKLTGKSAAEVSSRDSNEILYSTRSKELLNENPELNINSPEFTKAFIRKFYPFIKDNDVITIYKGFESDKKLENLQNWTGYPSSTGSYFSANPLVAESFARHMNSPGKLAAIDIPIKDFIESSYVRGFPFAQGNPNKTWTNEVESIINYLNVPDYVKNTLRISDVDYYENGRYGSTRRGVPADNTNRIYDILDEFYPQAQTGKTRNRGALAAIGATATAPVLGGWSGGLDTLLNTVINPGALAALGLGAAAMSPFGRRVLTMPYHAIRNRRILNNMIHISSPRGRLNDLDHPLAVNKVHGRWSGPGTYFSDRRKTSASDMFRDSSRDTIGDMQDWWQPIAGITQKKRLYSGWDRWNPLPQDRILFPRRVSHMGWDHKYIQKLRGRGVVGFHKPGYSTIFDFGVSNKWSAIPIPTPPRKNKLRDGIIRGIGRGVAKSGLIGGIPASIWYLLNQIGVFADGGLVRVGQDNLTLLGEGISSYAKKFTGTPYSSSAAWADGPKNGWGCATATKWLYDSYAGVDVGHPSLSASQYSSSAGSRVTDKMPGDLLFFYYPNGVNTSNPINHVGMYTGGGSMFHARSPELGTQVTGVDEIGMDRARTRAGGSAIKRYMPMTIAGMGVPAGKLAKGGKVYGKGGPTTDEVLAWISNGEYVMNAGAVRHYGKEFMDAVNKGILPEAAMGGMFSSKYPGVVQKMAGGGMLMSKYGKGGMVSSSANVEYNINVNVAGSNASPDEIANKVMQTIRRSDKMKGGGIRV